MLSKIRCQDSYMKGGKNENQRISFRYAIKML